MLQPVRVRVVAVNWCRTQNIARDTAQFQACLPYPPLTVSQVHGHRTSCISLGLGWSTSLQTSIHLYIRYFNDIYLFIYLFINYSNDNIEIFTYCDNLLLNIFLLDV